MRYLAAGLIRGMPIMRNVTQTCNSLHLDTEPAWLWEVLISACSANATLRAKTNAQGFAAGQCQPLKQMDVVQSREVSPGCAPKSKPDGNGIVTLRYYGATMRPPGWRYQKAKGHVTAWHIESISVPTLHDSSLRRIVVLHWCRIWKLCLALACRPTSILGSKCIDSAWAAPQQYQPTPRGCASDEPDVSTTVLT